MMNEQMDEFVREFGMCQICREPLKHSVHFLIQCVHCRHYFHRTCAQKWVDDHGSCPECKAKTVKGRIKMESRRLPDDCC